MELEFSIEHTPVKLTRGWFWGGMKLETPDHCIWLQHPLDPRTHFSFQTTQSWRQRINGHEVRVEKTRALLLAGVRNQSYRIFVDDSLVASADGM